MDSIEKRLRRRLAEVEDRPAASRHLMEGVPEAARDPGADDECDPRRSEVAWERQQAAALAARTERERGDLLAALDRLAAGTYGLCEVCGRPIPAARLEARPTTTRCVDHAS